MSSATDDKFLVDTMPTKEVVVKSLTKDVSIEECIFDLLDNSIDGARNDMRRKGRGETDERGLPSSYEDYWIRLKISGMAATIRDNCGGMEVPDLRDLALRFGKRSNHSFGIGTYGVGLNRAIFRLGSAAKIITDDGSRRSTVKIDHAAYIASTDWTLPATSEKSSGIVGTTVEIQRPPPPVAREFSSSTWLERVKGEIQRRYFAFLAKGLAVSVNDEQLFPEFVALREDGQYKIQKTGYMEFDNVRVYMVSGQHIKYRLTNEADFDFSISRGLTDEFGWNVICNDRAVLVSDRTAKTGWKVWHPEYNGFVGYIWFVSEDPEKLPWNTRKTDVESSNKVYSKVLKGMRELASNWRTFNRKTKKKPRDSAATDKDSSSKGASGQGSNGASDSEQRDHLKYNTVLPPDIDDHHLKDKMLRLVREAQTLDLSTHLYSGLLLLRALFEMVAVDYLKRHRQLGRLKEFHFKEIDAKRQVDGRPPMSEPEKRNYAPSFEDICAFFLENGDVWGIEDFSYMKHSLERLKNNKKKLNGVAHNPMGMETLEDGKSIRDATTPLIRHLLA